MAKHNQTGKKGEALAKIWFENNGYIILHSNWRHKHREVDIIATKDGILHFIEVKTRTSLMFGYPEDNVSIHKIAYLTGAAEEYLYVHPQWQRIQFDILSINMKDANVADYFLIEDVYL